MDSGKATSQSCGDAALSTKAYHPPVLRIYGACTVLTATVSTMSAERDAQGGGSIKTH
jgi:hypothetical protein